MEITYLGHASFKIKGKNISLIIDPFNEKIGQKFPKQKCDLLLVTHDHFDHNCIENVSEYKLLINGPGEYESGGVFVYGVSTKHDNNNGSKRGDNTIYLIEIDGFNVLHLGDLGHELKEETLEKIHQVDVLLIPVGGKYTIDAETAVKVISLLEPGIVVPMHYKTDTLTDSEGMQGVDKFVEEMGADQGARKEDKLKLTSESDVPEETETVLLKPYS